MRHYHNHNAPPAISAAIGLFMVCFGIFWTVMAMGMSPIMAIFGVFWTAIAVMITVNNIKASLKRKEENENPEAFVPQEKEEEYIPQELRCPYCGAPIHRDDRACEYCGSRL